jgi:hypothetical protein
MCGRRDSCFSSDGRLKFKAGSSHKRKGDDCDTECDNQPADKDRRPTNDRSVVGKRPQSNACQSHADSRCEFYEPSHSFQANCPFTEPATGQSRQPAASALVWNARADWALADHHFEMTAFEGSNPSLPAKGIWRDRIRASSFENYCRTTAVIHWTCHVSSTARMKLSSEIGRGRGI